MGDREDWWFEGAIQRAMAASRAARQRQRIEDQAQQATTPSSQGSAGVLGPEMALVMAQQATFMARLEAIENERLALPAPTGRTFGPAELTVVPAQAAPQLRLARGVRAGPMEVDDLSDIFGVESRIRDNSLRTQRRALRQERQQHYGEYAAAQGRIQEAAAAQAQQQAQLVGQYGEAQEQIRQQQQQLHGEALLQQQQRVALETQAAAQARELAELQGRLQRERDDLVRQHRLQGQAAQDQQAELKRQAAQIEHERARQAEREAALASEVRRVRQAHDEVAQARDQVQLTAAQVEQRVREAEERAYQRGKIDAISVKVNEPTPSTVPMPTAHTTGSAQQGLTMGGKRVPLLKDSKITIRTFNGKELHRGLGGGFKHWGRAFRDELEMAQQSCGYEWTDKFKISKLGSCLRGDAEEYFNGLRDDWWAIEPTFEYAMEEMDGAFSRSFTSAQVSEWFKTKKAPATSWHSHYLYLIAVRNATGASSAMIPESLVLHACAEMRPVLAGQYDKRRTDHIVHALEITQWAQTYEDNEKKPSKAVRIVAAVPFKETRICRRCTVQGHIEKDCPEKASGDSPSNPRYTLASLVVGDLTSDDFIADTGASMHLVRDKDMLHDWEEVHDVHTILPDGSKMEITRRGTAKLRVYGDGEYFWITLKDACYSPTLALNLVSLGTLLDKEKGGCELGTNKGRHAVLKDGCVVMYLQLKNNVLVVDLGTDSGTPAEMRDVVMSAMAESVAPERSVQRMTLIDAHLRFGHLNYDYIEKLASDPINGIELTDRVRKKCLTSAEGKQTKAAQPKIDTGTNAPIDIVGAVICSDLKGPITPVDRNKNRYMINFVDHKSNYCRVFVARTKDEAAKKLDQFIAFFEKRFNVKVHVLRTDGGGEYKNVELFCQISGIVRQITEANNSAANGKAERMHRTIMNMVRCMLFGCGLSLSFWGYAAEYAAYVLNRMPTRANPGLKSPIEILTRVPAVLIDIVIFGSRCTVYRNPKKKSLTKRGTPGIIVGKSDETKGYRVLLPASQVIVTTRHVGQIETLSGEANEQLKEVLEGESDNELEELARVRQAGVERHEHVDEEEQEECTSAKGTSAQKKKQKRSKKTQLMAEPREGTSESETGGDHPRRSRRTKKMSQRKADADDAKVDAAAPTRKGKGPLVIATTGVGRTAFSHLLAMTVLGAGEERFADLPDPKTYKASLASEDAHLWVKARAEEIASLVANGTWVVERRVKDMHLLRSKWVLKKKKDGNGAIERYKARLVAGGNDQVLGRDYDMTFAAVLDMTSGKVILAIARIWRVRARHYDVPSAYVKAHKEDEFDIYLRVPEGMVFSAQELQDHGVHDSDELCLRLVKSLYGLKQAGRLWNKLLHETLLKIGFVQSLTDACVYYKVTKEGTVVVGTYVDDLLVTATDDRLLDQFGSDMASLELKDLGPVENFLGMRIDYDDESGYKIDQEQSIVELLQKNRMEKANAVRAPIADESSLESESKESEPLPSKGIGTPEKPTVKSFQSLVGSLLWIARCSRPDIAYAVHRATRQSHAPSTHDMKMAKRILRYLAGTAAAKLHMGGDASGVTAASYTDADYAADKATRKSVSGALLLVQGMPVGWQVKQQSAVALSTAEAEFVAAAMGAKELLGLKNLLDEVGVRVELPMRMLIDNQAAIKQVENEATSSAQKHVDVKLKFIRDVSDKGVVKPEYVETALMLADVFTKSLPAPRLAELRKKIGVI